MNEPATEIFLVKTRYGYQHAGGTHSTKGSYYITEKGARAAGGTVLKGTVTWEELPK